MNAAPRATHHARCHVEIDRDAYAAVCIFPRGAVIAATDVIDPQLGGRQRSIRCNLSDLVDLGQHIPDGRALSDAPLRMGRGRRGTRTGSRLRAAL